MPRVREAVVSTSDDNNDDTGAKDVLLYVCAFGALVAILRLGFDLSGQDLCSVIAIIAVAAVVVVL